MLIIEHYFTPKFVKMRLETASATGFSTERFSGDFEIKDSAHRAVGLFRHGAFEVRDNVFGKRTIHSQIVCYT